MADIQRTQQCNLLHLPVELLNKVFEFLCLHCQSDPNVVADYDTPDAWESNRSLARICRVCRTTCLIAQPILFHYYASGNMQKITGFREISNIPEEDDLLPSFLCSILQQPKLSRAVKVLSFVPGSFPNGMAHHAAQLLIHESFRMGLTPPVSDLKFLLEHLRRDGHETVDNVSESEARPNSIFSGRVHHWLQGLAVSNTPCVEQLHVNFRPPRWLAALAPNVMLDRLRIFAITGQGPQFLAPHISRLVNAAPNLKTLCGSDMDFSFEMGIRPTSLQKLSINGPTSGVLQVLLSYCPKLQDLEYY